jgi:hypothetical protein
MPSATLVTLPGCVSTFHHVTVGINCYSSVGRGVGDQHLLCSEDPTFFGTINRLDCGEDSSGYTDISCLQVLTSARAAVFALSPYPK